MKPLADLVRPRKLSEVYGQQHILGENKILDRIVKSGRISNMILWATWCWKNDSSKYYC